MLNHKEVLEALLAGKVLRDIHDNDVLVFMGTDSVLYDEEGTKYDNLPLHDWELIPETININGIDVPKPESKELICNTLYYIPKPEYKALYTSSCWNNHRIDKLRLERGLIHLTKENAIAHAKAIISLTGSLDEEETQKE